MTTAFVLSGGGTLGAVQAGMLLALADHGVTPDLLVGASVGALNAAYVAADPSPAGVNRLADLWRGIRRHDVFPTPGPRAVAALAGRRNHLVSGAALRRLVTAQLPYDRLEDAPTQVSVVATVVTTGQEVVLSRGPAVESVLASAALPAMLPPVEVDGHLLMDGGVVNNSPISVAVDLGADRVIVLPTGYACALPAPPRSALGMALHAVTVAIQRRLIADVAALQNSLDVWVLPPLCPLSVSPIDFTQTESLITRARTAARGWLDAPPPRDATLQLMLHRHQAPTPLPRQENGYVVAHG